jgi:hypothetical protein
MSRPLWLPAVSLALLFATGCVERTMTIKSEPPGALVYFNDQELGRTPFKRDFIWYGDYEVQVRKEGYHALKTHTEIKGPWWEIVPFDFFAELIPAKLSDHHEISYKLEPLEETAVNPQELVTRGEQLRGELRSSRFTRPASTRPATQPATKPS